MEHKIFTDFLEEGISAEEKNRFGPAVSNYYKALTVLCSFLIVNKLGKSPKNHQEIFLFLKVSFPDVYSIVDNVFSVYTASYDHLMSKEDCSKIKNAIQKTAQLGQIEEKFAEDLKKI